jgi:hypothetical protein
MRKSPKRDYDREKAITLICKSIINVDLRRDQEDALPVCGASSSHQDRRWQCSLCALWQSFEYPGRRFQAYAHGYAVVRRVGKGSCMNGTVNGRLAQSEHLSYPPPSFPHDLTQETPVPTVYLIAQPTVKRGGQLPDLTPLAEYGEVKVLINSGEYPALHPERCRDLIKKRLATFDQNIDFIAWAGGDTLAAVFTGVMLERMGMNHIRWLKFQRGWDNDGERDPNKSYYREVIAPLFDGDGEEEEEEEEPFNRTDLYTPDPRD